MLSVVNAHNISKFTSQKMVPGRILPMARDEEVTTVAQSQKICDP
jgi:hypothetical protein